MSAFAGEYAPLPSRAKEWAGSAWDVAHDDLFWPFVDRDEAEAGERVRVMRGWDKWQTERAFRVNGWTAVSAT